MLCLRLRERRRRDLELRVHSALRRRHHEPRRAMLVNSDTFSICVLSVSLTQKVSLFQCRRLLQCRPQRCRSYCGVGKGTLPFRRMRQQPGPVSGYGYGNGHGSISTQNSDTSSICRASVWFNPGRAIAETIPAARSRRPTYTAGTAAQRHQHPTASTALEAWAPEISTIPTVRLPTLTPNCVLDSQTIKIMGCAPSQLCR